MKKILVSVLSSCLLASALSAVSFKEDSLKVSFEGYKTKDMIVGKYYKILQKPYQFRMCFK